MTAAPVRSAVRDTSTPRGEVLAGLLTTPKTLPPKLFYDRRGAELFEQICDLPEYYLTQSELSILRARAGDIARLAGPDCAVVEYGSGAGIKIRVLLDSLQTPRAYVPVDISRAQLEAVAAEVSGEYPGIEVHPIHADYTSRFSLPDLPASVRRRIAFFPGSTIGNFHPAEAAAFLSKVRQAVGRGGALLLGVDRVKNAGILEAAYNDSAGVTADFNRNILNRINRDLDADFDIELFEHVAFFNEEATRIEMHLKAIDAQAVHVDGIAVPFAAGETIWTESSYKYSAESLTNLVSCAGFEVSRLWTDDAEQFYVAWLTSA